MNDKKDVESLINLRTKLINRYEKLKDYRQNKNAIMREIDHAKILHEVIVSLDLVLKNYVNFKDG